MSDAACIKEYEARLHHWATRKKVDDKLFNRIGNLRLAIAAIGVLFAFLIFGPSSWAPLALLLPLTTFVACVVWQSGVMRRRVLADRAIRHYQRGLARAADQWSGTGQNGDRFRKTDHIYADDLDLFGKGSLFELIANTRTSAGEETLANWLLTAASVEEAVARQEAVAELTDRLDLREHLALTGPDIQNEAHIQECEAWAAASAVFFPPALRIVAVVLATAAIVLLIGFLAEVIPFYALLAIAAVNIGIGFVYRKQVVEVLNRAEGAGHGLPVLAATLRRFEVEKFHCSKLLELSKRLEVHGAPASARIHQLSRWMDWVDSSDHILVRAIRPLVLWREQIAMGLESWRQTSGPYIAGWLRTIGELEALTSFAALAYERPSWTFPQFSSDPGHFSARQLRHPLLPSGRAVANDICFRPPLQVVILSGSNMSGKSTLLRAIGVNAVLSFAGAPVSAASLRLSRIETAASIRVTDSLADNRSRFFAEILRLKRILDLAGKTSVLFLLDEILSGTNSHDRRIGAAALVKKLAWSGGIGLVTTHDLALSEIERDLGERGANMHLEDRIQDGKMEFDYQLKPGVVTHSNALELMRAVGLEV